MSQTMNKEMINLLVATAQQVPRATVCEQDKVCTQNLAWYLIKRHNLTDCSSLSSDDACHGSSRLAYRTKNCNNWKTNNVNLCLTLNRDNLYSNPLPELTTRGKNKALKSALNSNILTETSTRRHRPTYSIRFGFCTIPRFSRKFLFS